MLNKKHMIYNAIQYVYHFKKFSYFFRPNFFFFLSEIKIQKKCYHWYLCYQFHFTNVSSQRKKNIQMRFISIFI